MKAMTIKKRPYYVGPDKDGNIAITQKEMFRRASLFMRMLRDKYQDTNTWIEFHDFMRKEDLDQAEFNHAYRQIFARYGFKQELPEPNMDVLKEFVTEVKKLVANRPTIVAPTGTMQ